MQVLRNKKTLRFSFILYACHHTSWCYLETGRKEEAWSPFIYQFSPVYVGICFVPNSSLGTVRDKGRSKTSCPLRTHKERGQSEHEYQIQISFEVAEIYVQSIMLPSSIPFLPLAHSLPSFLAKLSYSKCLLARQL